MFESEDGLFVLLCCFSTCCLPKSLLAGAGEAGLMLCRTEFLEIAAMDGDPSLELMGRR